jgi:hypothetical protein
MDLKCSTFGPEHKKERFRSIKVIVNFRELLEVGKIGVFDKNSYYIMFVGKRNLPIKDIPVCFWVEVIAD